MLNGMYIIQDHTLIDRVLDWSACRSPSRAKLRHRLGHPQRMKIAKVNPRAYRYGSSIICHPSIVDAISAALAAKEPAS